MRTARRALKKVEPYTVFNESRRHKIRLDLNENAWGCSAQVLERLKNLSAEDVSLYPDCSGLVRKLAAFHGVSPDNLMLSNGADDSIRCVFDCLVEEGDELLIPVPNYGMFDIFGRIRNAGVVNVCYNDDFSFPTERLLKQLSGRSKLIVIVNPANPLATVIDERDLRRILETARDAFVLLDETYYHFINRSYIDWLSEFDNLIIVQTFSKAFGLTGLRLGITFSNVETMSLLKKVNLPFAVNSLATLAAEAALDDTDFLYTVVANVKTETAFLKANLEKLGIEVRTGFTNFLMMNFGNSSQQVYQQLFDRGILLRNLKKYPLLAGYLRASIGTRADNKKFLAALKEIVGNND